MSSFINSISKGMEHDSARRQFRNLSVYILDQYYFYHKFSFDINELVKKYNSFIVVQVMNYCCCEKKDSIYYINFESVNKLEQYIYYFHDFSCHFC